MIQWKIYFNGKRNKAEGNPFTQRMISHLMSESAMQFEIKKVVDVRNTFL